jgi:hypothetical protein
MLQSGYMCANEAEPAFPPAAAGISLLPKTERTTESLDQCTPQVSAHSTQSATSTAPVTATRLLQVEDSLRSALKRRRTVYESERALLEKAFRLVDDGTGDITPQQFQQACVIVNSRFLCTPAITTA